MDSSLNKNLLIINTAHTLRQQIRTELADLNFDSIDECSDGLDAIKMLNAKAYDLIITDIDLGNLDAWRLTRLIRSDMLASDAMTKIIILSSTHSDRIAEATSKEFEVNRFVPFSQLQQINKIVNELLSATDNEIPKPRILVIEDYQDTADLIDRILHKRFDITHAADGQTGLAAWEKDQHEIVLLDLMLPKMSGEEVLKTILKTKPEQTVIMMTAHGDSLKASQLILAGAVDFISKPFKADRLRHVCAIASHREDFVVSNEQFREKQYALTQAKNRAQITLQSIADGVITTNQKGIIDYINPVAQKILKYNSEEVINMDITDIFATYHETSHIPTANLVKRAIAENDTQRSAKITVLKDRENNEVLIEQQAAPIRNNMGMVIGAVLIFQDQTQTTTFEKRLSFHATHDPLTGLYNRGAFDEEVKIAVQETEENGMEHSVCQLSLSQFNIVNESCGHIAGDKLLQDIAQLLKKQIRAPSDVIARIAGDEFGILLRHSSLETAQQICELIASEVENLNFEFNGITFEVNVGIGITLLGGNIANLSDAISAANAACNMAKERGKNRVACYSGKDIELVEKRQEVFYANELTNAINSNRIVLFQQKIASGDIDCKDSFEILTRIQDEDGNLQPPGPYLNAAERYNITSNLDRWVINHTLDWLQDNAEITDTFEYISINLSGLSICDDSFTEFITKRLNETKIPPEKICFEITETSAISNFIQASNFITAIRDLGCKFALDDFGSGMSSFAYLKKLPVDILKIDGMFVRDILENPIDLAMVKSINDIGHVMGLKTVAEYVENAEILKVLNALEVDSFQGYHVAKPAPIDELVSRESVEEKFG